MSEGDLGSRTVSALKWSYGGAVVRALAQLLVQMLLARLLGPEAFGQAMAAFLVLALGWLMSEGGFGSALVQKAELNDGDIGYALGWVLLLSGATGGLVVAASPWLAQWLGGPELRPLIIASGVLIPLQAVSNIPSSLMRRNLDMRRSQFIYLGAYAVAYGAVGLPLAWAGAGPWSLVLAFGLHSLINLVGSYAVVRHTLRPRLRGDAALRRFGMQVTGTNLASWAIENIDRLLVNRFWGVAALGEYTAALTLSRAPANFLVSSMQSVTFATASRLQDDRPRLARSYLALLALVCLVSGPIFMLMALHAQTLVHVIYGERWANTGPLFAAFCAGLPFFAVLAVTGPLLWAVDAVRQELWLQSVAAVVMAAGFLLLRDLPLAQAVWLVPVMYALRMLWLVRALALRLDLGAAALLRAAAGGAGLSLLALALTAAAAALLPPLAALALACLATLLLSCTLLWLRPRWLLAPELATLLHNRAGTSALLAAFCRWTGLTRS